MSEQNNIHNKEQSQLLAAKEMALKIAGVLDSKKALNVKILAVTEQTIIADYFVIAAGTSSTHVNSLADEVEFKLGQEGTKPARVEGQHSGSWILIDYSTVLVHIFSNEQRDFYKLEKLWADGTEVSFSPQAQA